MGLQTEIRDIDYNEFVSLLGTAHFTKRSVREAYETVERLKPSDLAIELDLQRFNVLNGVCASCPKRSECDRKCEFVGAADALGNADANIWLIDMSEYEIAVRIRSVAHPFSSDVRSYITYADVPFFYDNEDGEEDEVSLWERGFKERVLDANQRRLELLRRRAPAVWRVLIDERNTLMAARLAWIVSKSLDEGGRKPKILAVVGAAHVDGIRELLANPFAIKENMRRLGLRFTPPTLIRRVRIKGD